MRIEYFELPGEEFISIRPTFGEALTQVLPATDDHAYEYFRLRFFSLVFHPTSAAEREAIRQLVSEAQAKFATRL